MEVFEVFGGEILFVGCVGVMCFIYFDMGFDFGMIYEMVDLVLLMKEFFDMVCEVGKVWDGVELIRWV